MMEREEIFSEFRAHCGVVDYSPDFRNEPPIEISLFQEDAGSLSGEGTRVVPLVVLRQFSERNNDRWYAVCG